MPPAPPSPSSGDRAAADAPTLAPPSGTGVRPPPTHDSATLAPPSSAPTYDSATLAPPARPPAPATATHDSATLAPPPAAPPTSDSRTISAGARSSPGEEPRLSDFGTVRARERPAPREPAVGLATARRFHRGTERYRIDGELGRGGMGVVFRAFDRDLQREVALKVMLHDAGLEDDLAARFVEEARATAQLQHPGIVPVYEIGIDEERRLFFAMKLVEGRTLAKVLEGARARGPEARDFSLFRLCEVFIDVARAVYFAHERGVIHRDLKPQNVMIGPYGEVQVMDWGLAKLVGPEGDAAEVLSSTETAEIPAARQAPPPPSRAHAPPSSGRSETLAGTVVGTPAYMPPEQAAGDTPRIGRKADVYSLGATLYEVLTGRPPFIGPTTLDIMRKLATEEPPRPRSLDRAIPPELEAVCLRALAKRPEDRYESAKALADDVHAWLEHRPVAAYREGVLGRAVKWARRHRRPLLAVGAVLLATALGVWITGRRARAGFTARAREDARRAVERLERARSPGAASAGRRAAASPPAATAGAEERHARNDRLLGLALEALQEAGHLAAILPEEEAARAQAFGAALSLGEIALAAEQWSLAESAFQKALAYGVDDERARVALASVARGRTRVEEEHRRAVLDVLADARSGALGSRPGGYEDALFALVGYREAQTVAVLSDALDGVTRDLRAAARDCIMAAAMPTAEEERAGVPPIAGLAEALAAEQARSLGAPPLPTRTADPLLLAARRLEDRERRALPFDARGSARSVRALVAAAQERRLGPGGAVLARLCCEALGRLGIADGAVDALARYLAAEEDEQRAACAGVAACLLRGGRVVLAARARHGEAGAFWRTVGHFAERLVDDRPVATETAAAYEEHAALLGARGDLAGAVADIDRALALDPGSAGALAARGTLRRRLGDTDGAIADLTRSLSIATGSAAVLVELGWTREDRGDLDGAIAEYVRATEADPRLSRAWQFLGHAYQDREDVDRALAALDRAVALDPSNAPALCMRGWCRRERKDLARAIEDTTRAVEADPRLAQAWYVRGRARLESDQTEAGLADLSRAVELEPTLSRYRKARADARIDAGDLEGAIDDLTRALEAQPLGSGLWRKRGEARRSRGDGPGAIADLTRAIELDPTDAEAWTLRAWAHNDGDDFAAAVADATRAVELSPGDADALLARAAARVNASDLDAGIADYTAAIELRPDDGWTYASRALARDRKGDLDGALADANRAVELGERSAWALGRRAGIHLERREAAEAVADADAALAADARHAPALLTRAEAAWELGRDEGALADVARALEVDPSSQRALRLRAGILRERGDRAGSLAALDRSVAISRTALSLTGRAVGRRRCGDAAGAFEDLRAAVALDPSYADGWNALSYAHLAGGDVAAAREAIERAIALDPKDASYLDTRGMVLERAGDRDGALAAVEAALAKDPRCAGAWLNRGLLRAASGDSAGAIADVERYLSIASVHHERRKEGEAKLAELRR